MPKCGRDRSNEPWGLSPGKAPFRFAAHQWGVRNGPLGGQVLPFHPRPAAYTGPGPHSGVQSPCRSPPDPKPASGHQDTAAASALDTAPRPATAANLLNRSHKGLPIKTSAFQLQWCRPPAVENSRMAGDPRAPAHPTSRALSGLGFPVDYNHFAEPPGPFFLKPDQRYLPLQLAALSPATGTSISGFVCSRDTPGSLRWVSMSTCTEIQTFGFLKGSLTSATTSSEWQRIFFQSLKKKIFKKTRAFKRLRLLELSIHRVITHLETG